MKDSPTVTIITLNWNGLSDTENCLRSIFEHTTENVHVIVWDNGSRNDEASAIEKTFGDRVMVHRSPMNVGITGGYNGAAKLARSEYLVFLNNDAEVTAGWLSPLLTVMENDPSVGACQPKIRSWYKRDRFDYSGACGGFLDMFGYPFTRGRIFSEMEEDHGQYDTTMDIHWASAACMVIRKTLWDELGGVDEGFFVYMDEIDLCWRLRLRGHRIVCVPRSTAYHKGAETMKKFPARKRYFEHRNNLLMLLKNLPTTDLVWRLPIRLGLEWVSIVHYCCAGEWAAARGAFRAFVSFLLLAPRYALKRATATTAAPLAPVSIVEAYFLKKKRKFSSLRLPRP